MSEVFQKPAPLKIKCTDSDCDNDLHCFKAARSMAQHDKGKCRACNADLVDWSRLHRRNLKDVKYTFEALQQELIRHHHFHKVIDDVAINHARRKGRIKLLETARARLEHYVAGAANPREGRQTPFEGNAIFYAQHATACCCRVCLEYWHAIPKGRAMTEKEIDYCLALIELYFEDRLPDLDDNPEKVPARRRLGLEPSDEELPD